jgi:hypothetical protein
MTSIKKYGQRNGAVYLDGSLVCVTVRKKCAVS